MSVQMVTGIFLSLLIIFSVAYALYRVKQRDEYKDMELGAVIFDLLFNHERTVTVTILIAIILGETMIAGTLVDERTNPVGRMMPHLAMGIMSIVGAITFAKQLTLFAESFRSKSVGIVLARFITVISSGVMTLLAPAANTLILANGYHQTDIVALLYYQLFYPETVYISKVVQAGYNWPFNALKEINNGLLASLILTLFGTLITIEEVATTLIRRIGESIAEAAKADKSKEKKEDKKEEKKDEKKDETSAPPPEVNSHIKKILTFYFGRDVAKADEYLKVVLAILPSKDSQGKLTPAQQIVVGKKLAELFTKIEAYNRAPTGVKNDLLVETRTTFAKNYDEGGLGVTLPLASA